MVATGPGYLLRLSCVVPHARTGAPVAWGTIWTRWTLWTCRP